MKALPLILMYHSVAKYEQDPFLITVSPERFAEQMRWLARGGRRGVSVAELRAASNPRGLVGLTFDDGYTDFATEVVPVLRRHRFTATVFAVAGELGGTNVWDSGCPRKSLLTGEELRWVAAAGMEVASHTVRHRSLPDADDAALHDELTHSKAILEAEIGAEVTGFAYPYGHVGAREAAAVRAAGYDYACAIWKSELSGQYALPRSYIGDRDGPARLQAKRLRHHLRWGWST